MLPVKVVLIDGGGRGRPRSDRRAFVFWVERLLIDGNRMKDVLLGVKVERKPFYRRHERSSVGARPFSAAPVDQNPLDPIHGSSSLGAQTTVCQTFSTRKRNLTNQHRPGAFVCEYFGEQGIAIGAADDVCAVNAAT